MGEVARINIIRNDLECCKLESVYHHLENANKLIQIKPKHWGQKLAALFLLYMCHSSRCGHLKMEGSNTSDQLRFKRVYMSKGFLVQSLSSNLLYCLAD